MSHDSFVDVYNEVFALKSRVLLVFAHPNDMEVNCGGLAARLCADGKAVRLVCMTAGERGVRQQALDIAEFRKARLEALRLAAMVIGIAESEICCLGIPDGCVENDMPHIGMVVEQIRMFKPDLIITHNPTGFLHTVDESYNYVNHRDHRLTAAVTIDALYPYSRDWAFFSEIDSADTQGHVVEDLLIGDSFEDGHAVAFEVSDHIQTKVRALSTHLERGAMTEEQFESYSAEGRTDHGVYEILAWWHNIR